MDLVQLDRILTAYDRLGHGTKLHVGYAFRHRTPTAWTVLEAQHGREPELLVFLDRCREAGLSTEPA